jgi:hypothetical protein
MTAMTRPESGDVAARLAQASRLIRHAQSLAEKIAELTEDELASLCGLAAMRFSYATAISMVAGPS